MYSFKFQLGILARVRLLTKNGALCFSPRLLRLSFGARRATMLMLHAMGQPYGMACMSDCRCTIGQPLLACAPYKSPVPHLRHARYFWEMR